MSKREDDLNEYRALVAVAAAADSVLNYAGLDDLLDSGNDTDAFGIRVEHLRRLRKAMQALNRT